MLLAAIDDFSGRLAQVRANLEHGDAKAITDWNEAARADRERLLVAGLSSGPVAELRVSLPNRPGVIAEIALALGRAGVNILDLALAPSEDNRQGVVALWIGGDVESARAEGLIAELGYPVARA